MRKVKNRKVIGRLSNKSFQASRTRNVIAMLAIALTAMLFTALFTIGLGSMENFQRETMRQSGGDSHGVFKNLTREQYEKLSQDSLIVESADCMMLSDEVRNPEFLKRHLELWYYPEYHYSHCFVEIVDGEAPETADEILIDETSLQLLGLEAKAGQQVTLELRLRSASEEITERTFTVSGVIRSDPAFNVGLAIASQAYQKAHEDELAYTWDENGSNTGAIRMDVNFANSLSIQKKLDQVIVNSGYSVDDGSPDYISSNANWAYVSDGAGADPTTMGAVIGALLLIILTGYLIIYNIFQISVIRDIRYYGLLKTIGTTGRQIKRILRRQAILLGALGIPIGLVLGFFLGKGVVPMFIGLSSFQGNEIVVSFNPLILVGAAGFTLLTVWISVGKPARIAAKVSPVEAVRYIEGKEYRKKQKKSTDGGKLWRMALSNLDRSRGRTILVLLSLSLAVILLNSVFTVTHSFDLDTYLKKFVSSDFLIANARYFGLDSYYGIPDEIQEERVSESFIKACKEQEGFENGGRLYGSVFTVGLKEDSWTIPSYVPTDEKGTPGTYWGSEFIPFNRYSDEAYATAFYGIEDFFYEELEVYKGESDPDTIREKLKSGDYLVCAVSVDDNDFVTEEDVMHQPGDTVTLTYGEGQEREFTILSLIKENYYGLTNRMGNTFSYYTDAEVFTEMLSDEYVMSYAFNAQDDKEAAIASFLESYTTAQEPLMHYESKQYWLDQFSGMTDLFLVVGGVLSFVVGLIGVLNFMNSILTSMVTRQREFAMMEAIGMTKRQLSNMLMLEGLYYALATIAVSLGLGCLFSVTVLRVLTEGMWFMKYHFVVFPMLLVFPILLLMGLAVPRIAYHFNRRESVVERLRSDSQ